VSFFGTIEWCLYVHARALCRGPHKSYLKNYSPKRRKRKRKKKEGASLDIRMGYLFFSLSLSHFVVVVVVVVKAAHSYIRHLKKK
jgi:hypothetical protein